MNAQFWKSGFVQSEFSVGNRVSGVCTPREIPSHMPKAPPSGRAFLWLVHSMHCNFDASFALAISSVEPSGLRRRMCAPLE